MEKNSEPLHGSRKQEAFLLTGEQAKTLLEATQKPPLKALLTVAITTGLRRGELLGLRWRDLDMQNSILHVHQMVTPLGRIEAPKVTRTIALSEIAVRALNEQRKCQEGDRAQAGEAWQDLDLVFPDESGRYLNAHELWRQYHALFIDQKFPHLRFHDIRHNTAVLLLQMGVSIAVVRAILGYRQNSPTINVLTPVTLSMQKDAMKKWDDLLGES